MTNTTTPAQEPALKPEELDPKALEAADLASGAGWADTQHLRDAGRRAIRAYLAQARPVPPAAAPRGLREAATSVIREWDAHKLEPETAAATEALIALEAALAAAPVGELREQCRMCRQPVGSSFWLCDLEALPVCEECQPQTACGRGDHGEGCATHIISDEPCAKDEAKRRYDYLPELQRAFVAGAEWTALAAASVTGDRETAGVEDNRTDLERWSDAQWAKTKPGPLFIPAATPPSGGGDHAAPEAGGGALVAARDEVIRWARALVMEPGGLRNNGHALCVVEKRDNSDPHAKLCDAFKALDAIAATARPAGAEGSAGLPSPSAPG